MKLLLVEDDQILSDSIFDILQEVGEVTQVYDGEEAVYEGERGVYDLIILDLMLPEKSGEDVLIELRQKQIYTPVLILTAKGSFEDKMKGFRNGADDYLTKPFHREELLLRSQALIRRSLGIHEGNELKHGQLKVDLSSREVLVGDTAISLQGKEFDLLEYFMQNKNQIITKDQLFDRIWGFQSDTTLSVVEVYMSNLRKRLKPFGLDSWIVTIRNVGYIFQPNEE